MFEQTNQTESAAMESTAFPGEVFESGNGADVSAQTGSEATEKNSPAVAMAQGTEQKYAVKYNGKEVLLSLEELKTRAQMGMNYEHVKSENDRIKGSAAYQKLNELAQREGVRLEALDTKSVFAEHGEANSPYLAFVKKFPQIKPEEISPQVWERFAQSGDLIGAYTEAENERLRAQIQAMEQNEKNARAHIGSLKNERATAHTDAFLEGLLGG